jgi:membrane protein
MAGPPQQEQSGSQTESRSDAPPPRPGLHIPILHFLNQFRRAVWRAFQHDAFAMAKASAYSLIFTFFPALMVIGSVLASSRRMEVYLREISYAVGKALPAGSSTAMLYLRGTHRPLSLVVSTALLTLWTASGAVVSWMEAFRRAYELPKVWGLLKERLIAFSLVILAGIPLTFATMLVAFGSRIETRILFYTDREFGPYILLLWTATRWLIAILSSMAVIALIYHNAVPRTQPWHSVLPGSVLATAMWFVTTAGFSWYLQRYADYTVIYGSLGVGIALLVWMYLISLIILIGAEFNAMLFPRALKNGVAARPAA